MEVSRARGPGESSQPRNLEKIWCGGGPARRGGLPARCPPRRPPGRNLLSWRGGPARRAASPLPSRDLLSSREAGCQPAARLSPSTPPESPLVARTAGEAGCQPASPRRPSYAPDFLEVARPARFSRATRPGTLTANNFPTRAHIDKRFVLYCSAGGTLQHSRRTSLCRHGNREKNDSQNEVFFIFFPTLTANKFRTRAQIDMRFVL